MRYLGYDPDLPARIAVACVRTLRLIGTDAARQCLKGYCSERRPTVVSELRVAVDPLELAIVQERVTPIRRRSAWNYSQKKMAESSWQNHAPEFRNPELP